MNSYVEQASYLYIQSYTWSPDLYFNPLKKLLIKFHKLPKWPILDALKLSQLIWSYGWVCESDEEILAWYALNMKEQQL